jgi:hypothetical protein
MGEHFKGGATCQEKSAFGEGMDDQHGRRKGLVFTKLFRRYLSSHKASLGDVSTPRFNGLLDSAKSFTILPSENSQYGRTQAVDFGPGIGQRPTEEDLEKRHDKIFRESRHTLVGLPPRFKVIHCLKIYKHFTSIAASLLSYHCSVRH